MSIYEQEAIKRELRAYWNDCQRLHTLWLDEKIDGETVETQTIRLDTKYAKRISKIKEGV